MVLKDGRVVDTLEGDDVNEAALMNALAVESDTGEGGPSDG